MGLWGYGAMAIEKVMGLWGYSAREGYGLNYIDGRGGGGRRWSQEDERRESLTITGSGGGERRESLTVTRSGGGERRESLTVMESGGRGEGAEKEGEGKVCLAEGKRRESLTVIRSGGCGEGAGKKGEGRGKVYAYLLINISHFTHLNTTQTRKGQYALISLTNEIERSK